MLILSFKTGHDPAACLLEDGKIIAAAEEERFVRVKHAPDYFPVHAIQYCLSVKNVTLDGVEKIVFAREKNFKTFFKVAWYFLAHFPRTMAEAEYMRSLMIVQMKGLMSAIFGRAPYQQIFKIVGGRTRRIYSFDHHTCHAASAYFGSGFADAAILCMDGKGEATAISLWHGKDGVLHEIGRQGIFDSLGYLYGSFTDFLGFRMNDGEYKVMGMAAYGRASHSFDDVIVVDEKGVKINTRYSLYPFSLKHLAARFPQIAKEYNESAPPKENADIAATLQERLERAALWYAKKLLSQVPTKNLCFAGGVALNVKMNKAIWESGIAKRLWIQPAAGDMGNVLGAAWLLYYQKTAQMPDPMTHLYLGPEYGADEIGASLARHGVSYTKPVDIAEAVAKFLAEKKIIAWFQGRMEFGPRALGARSVLADPRSEEMKEVINAKVKFREPFRPFCPSFLEGHGEELFETYLSSPYMVMSFSVRPEWRTKIPAVCHVDNTARPQEVAMYAHPLFARMIECFYKKTGVPVVLNTSLNVRGEPIVNTPDEAITFFQKTDVDFLAVGPYLVTK